LAQFFVEKYARELGKDVRKISTEAMECLMSYGWPGNVRELENVIERAMALETTGVILPESLPSQVLAARGAGSAAAAAALSMDVDVPEEGLDLEAVVGAFERRILEKALARTGGVKKEAAKLLKVTFRSMRYRLAKYGIGGADDEQA
ncbi:MAG TPA: helix-turn-helix domain-containing protein, partial [bacterium]|nr:helix-turn-helix domain-containing protein [bacterium]